jgi:hypothetical protein
MKMLLFFYVYYFWASSEASEYPDAMQWLSGSPRGGALRKPDM